MAANLAEAQSHSITPEGFLKHYRDVTEAKRAASEAGTAAARAKKAAKEDAVDLKAYRILEMIQKLDDDEQAIVLRHFFQYTTWLGMPIGAQTSMLDAPKIPAPKATAKAEHITWQAGEAGLKAGRDGLNASDNPYPAGSEAFARWAVKFASGAEERETAASMGSTEKERPADKAPATRRAGQGRRGSNGGADMLDKVRTPEMALN